MTPRVVSYAGGARWLAEGWRLFRVAPLAWLVLVLAYWMLMTIASLVPLVGLAVATVLIPAFSVGFMAAGRSCAAGKAPELAVLFEGFRGRLAVQLTLGGAYLALLALLLGATGLADDGALATWMLTGRRPGDEVLQSDAFLAALALAAALYVPVMMLFWFAPPLAAWHGLGAAQALFYSFVASLLNWRAFLGYGALAALVTVVVPFLLLSALLLVSGGNLKMAATGLVFPLLIVLLPILFASFYASYREVFGAQGEG
jgi:hypothetical protein